jgi:hypothetical protein
MAASSIGASEKTVKKEMDAPKLMARSFHQPRAAILRRRWNSKNVLMALLLVHDHAAALKGYTGEVATQ